MRFGIIQIRQYKQGKTKVEKKSLEIFAEIIHPNLFNFNHKQSGWINFFK